MLNNPLYNEALFPGGVALGGAVPLDSHDKMEWKSLPPSCPNSSRRKSRTVEGCALQLPRREPLELEDDFEIPISFECSLLFAYPHDSKL